MREMVRQNDQRRPMEMPRISVRYRVSGATLEWTPPRRGLLPGRRRSVEAELLDLSVTGALIQAPDHPGLTVGFRIPIRIGNEDGMVEIRNVRPSDVVGKVNIGVVFHEMSDALRSAIYEAIGRLRDDERLRRQI
jgi:hypothetical protein